MTAFTASLFHVISGHFQRQDLKRQIPTLGARVLEIQGGLCVMHVMLTETVDRSEL